MKTAPHLSDSRVLDCMVEALTSSNPIGYLTRFQWGLSKGVFEITEVSNRVFVVACTHAKLGTKPQA